MKLPFHRHTDELIGGTVLPSAYEQAGRPKSLRGGSEDVLDYFAKRVVFTFRCTKCGRVRERVLP